VRVRDRCSAAAFEGSGDPPEGGAVRDAGATPGTPALARTLPPGGFGGTLDTLDGRRSAESGVFTAGIPNSVALRDGICDEREAAFVAADGCRIPESAGAPLTAAGAIEPKPAGFGSGPALASDVALEAGGRDDDRCASASGGGAGREDGLDGRDESGRAGRCESPDRCGVVDGTSDSGGGGGGAALTRVDKR
jgi:hypothetical protein